MTTRFSVILPTYNRATTLIPALRSVLDQSRPPDQVIVIDDGSDEDPAPVLAPYRDRIDYIRQDNGGAAHARNTAARHATGTWLTFQDSDDLWDRDHLAVVERDLAQAGPDVVCHLGDVTYVGKGYRERLFAMKGVTFPSGRAERVEDALGLVISGMTLQAAAIRSDMFHRMGGLDATKRMLEDTEFFCRLAFEGPFLVTSHNMADIVRVEGDAASLTSLTHTDPRYARQTHVDLLEPLLDRPLTPAQRALVLPRLSGARFRLAAEVSNTEPALARRLLLQAARTHPSRLRGWGKSAVALLFGQRGYRWMARDGGALDRG